MSPQAVRPLALTAMVGGALYVVVGLVQLTSPEQTDPFSRTSDYLIQLLLVLSLLLTLAGFVALHLRQAGVYSGPRGWTGFRAAVIGQGAMLVSALGSFTTGSLALSFLYFAGVCLLLVGLALLPVATYRAAILPHWSAYLVAALAAIIFGGFGKIVVGLTWIALAYVLWLQGGASAGRSSRVR
jgi:hypothetical protein